MITETGQDRPGQEEKDPTAGKGQPRSEGEGVARPGSDAGGAAAQQRARTSAEAGADGGAGDAGNNAAAADAPADDPEPAAELAEIAESVALAEVMKPVATATEDLYATAPDKVKARRAIVDDYAKALSTPPGDLLAKYEAADRRFVRTAQDMAETLEGWIERLLKDAGGTSAVARALGERAQLRSRLAALTGGREGGAPPGASRNEVVGRSLRRLVRPRGEDVGAGRGLRRQDRKAQRRHQQRHQRRSRRSSASGSRSRRSICSCATTPLDDEVIEKQIDDLKTALGPDSDLAAQFEPGSARQDGSLYLIPGRRARTTSSGRAGRLERRSREAGDGRGGLQAPARRRRSAQAALGQAQGRRLAQAGQIGAREARRVSAPPSL